ncbi:hypothetical protein HQ585_12780 [candidate division KSB1 bacterium]|nr:hypothetical protein [candidate division KSB1 bacterium]
MKIQNKTTKAIKVLIALQSASLKNGTDKITNKEIDREIKTVRKLRKNNIEH